MQRKNTAKLNRYTEAQIIKKGRWPYVNLFQTLATQKKESKQAWK
jgi:hypothetical protein